jgi:DNA-binding transcriptional LysR family regulator
MISTSLRRLSVFKAVVDCAGVNAAAVHLGIAQPSVSGHIRAIERQLGATLFVRQRGRKLRPTTAGAALYAYALDAVSKAEELRSALKQCDPAATQGFSLAAQRTLASTLLPSALANFLQRFPEARISMHSETQEIVRQLVKSEEVDLGIFYASDDRDHDADRIGREQLAFIAAPSHPLASRQQIDPHELRNFSFVSGLKQSQFFRLVDERLARIGLSEYRAVLHVQDTASVKRAVALNLGVACTLRSAVQEELVSGTLVLLPIAGETPELDICCLRRSHDLPELAKEFIDHLKQWPLTPPK